MSITTSITFNNKTRRYGFYIGIGNQGSGAPLVDTTITIVRNSETGEEIECYKGKGLLLTPWKRNQYNETLPQKTLVVGFASR
jgi:hypothetical protein